MTYPTRPSATPLELEIRLAIIARWMDVQRFMALRAAVDAKMGRA